MADVTISNSIPLNAGLTYTVTSTDASDGSVTFKLPAETKLLATGLEVLDARKAKLATTGALIDDSVIGEVTIGNAVAVAEVITLTVAGTVATTGKVAVAVRGGTPVDVVTTDEATATEVATAIAAETFTGWEVTSKGAVVTFTATSAEAKTGDNTFTLTTSTGITGTYEITKLGYDAGTFTLTAGTEMKLNITRDNSQYVIA